MAGPVAFALGVGVYCPFFPPCFQCPRVCLLVIRVWALGCFFAPMAFRTFIPLDLLLFAVPYVFLAISSVPLGSCLQAGLAYGQVLGTLVWPGVCPGLRLSSGGCSFPLLFMGWAFGPFWPPLWVASFLSRRVVAVFFPGLVPCCLVDGVGSSMIASSFWNCWP